MDHHIIELTELTKRYGSYVAVDHVNLRIKKGEIFGLLGPNGAGKSTTILMTLGLTEPTSGTVKVGGIDSTTNPVAVKKKVGYLPEDVGFYDDRTGIENLVYTARLNGMSEKEAMQKAGELLEKTGLTNDARKKTGKYSRGMRQRLGLADVLIKNPEVIILDEPTLGIDPRGMQEFLELIVRLSREDGLTVLLSSHHLHQVQQVCDRIGLFVNGRLIAEGDVDTLSQRLFADEPVIIEAGFIPVSTQASEVDSLETALAKLEGVVDIHREKNAFRIRCLYNIAPTIARTIVDSGAGLEHLHKKEYGLDEIYHRYFEGGKNDEKMDKSISANGQKNTGIKENSL